MIGGLDWSILIMDHLIDRSIDGMGRWRKEFLGRQRVEYIDWTTWGGKGQSKGKELVIGGGFRDLLFFFFLGKRNFSGQMRREETRREGN